MCLCAKLLQSCLTLCDPMDCSQPSSTVCGILQARILRWVAMPSSRGSALTQGLNLSLQHCRQILYHLMQFYCFTSIPWDFLSKQITCPNPITVALFSRGEVAAGMRVCGLRKILVHTNYYQISHNNDTMDLVCLIISVVNSKSLPD